MRKVSVVGAAAAIFLLTQPALSVPITYAVEGEITGYRSNVTNWPTDIEIPLDLQIGSALTGTITYDPDLVDPSASGLGRWLPAIKYDLHFGDFGFFSGPRPPPISYLSVFDNGFFMYDEVPWYTEVEHSPLTYFGPEHLWFEPIGNAGSALSELPEQLPFADNNLFHIYLRFFPESYHLSIDAEYRAVEVPEPAPLALFAFGLFSLVVAGPRGRRSPNGRGTARTRIDF